MSLIAMASVWNMTEDILSSEKFVLLVLANRANQDTGKCFPSLNTIARETCLAQRHVQRVIKSLETKGLITVERTKQDNGKNAPNQYRLNFEYTTKEQGHHVPKEQGHHVPKVGTPCPQGRDTMPPYGRDTMSPELSFNLKSNQAAHKNERKNQKKSQGQSQKKSAGVKVKIKDDPYGVKEAAQGLDPEWCKNQFGKEFRKLVNSMTV